MENATIFFSDLTLKCLEVGAVSWTISLWQSLFVWACIFPGEEIMGGRWMDTDTTRMRSVLSVSVSVSVWYP